MSRKPTPNIDYTSRDYEAFRALLIQKLQEKMPEYTDTTETDAGIVIIEALANGLDILSLYADIVANDVLLPTTQSRRLAVLLANCLGYYPYNQSASQYEQVFVLSATRTVDTIIPAGTVVKTKQDSTLATMYYVTLRDHIIPAGYLGDEVDENGNYLYHTTIVAGEVIRQDVIGTSSGAPMQSFMCHYTKVLVDSIEVYVNEGAGAELWTRVDTFFDSDQDSKVYIVLVDEFDRCTIQFGNGIKGKVPTVFPNGISATYRIGGGESSNVSTNTITSMETTIAHVAKTFNLDVDVQGHDKETLESIKVNAPAAFRTRDRLVTLKDYEDLIRMNFYEFLDLKAVRDVNDRRLVHIYYMMRTGYIYNSSLVSRVSSFVGERSMIGCIYDMTVYTPQTVNISATLYVDSDYGAAAIESNVRSYLSDVVFSYGNLLFEDSLVKSDVEQEIKNMFPGIISFRINTPSSDIISPSAANNVLTLGTVNITTTTI